jgi:hypothetical protein
MPPAAQAAAPSLVPSECSGHDWHSRMLFKTNSASVYGIDAHLMVVEVDVGSARMADFNMVGLPDNAVTVCPLRFRSGQNINL